MPHSTSVDSKLLRWLRFPLWLAFFLSAYLLYAHLALPALLQHYEHHPALRDVPKTTSDTAGRPADPLNVGLLGERLEVVRAMQLAGWLETDPKTARLRLLDRRPDLSFARKVGNGAQHRHGVLFWKLEKPSGAGRPTWLGAATHERAGAGPGADVDYSRDRLIADLTAAAQVVLIYQVTGVGVTLFARTGAGRRYHTDGELSLAVLPAGNVRQTGAPDSLPNPKPVVIKGRIWSAARQLLGAAVTTGS